jgi:hypothetical protein
MTFGILTPMLWWGGLALEAALLTVIVYRRLYRGLPIFFGYMVLLFVRTVALIALHRRGGAVAYFYAYWASEVLCWAWSLAAVQEAMERLFAPYAAVRRLVLVVFRWGAALLIVFAVMTAYVSPGADSTRMMQGILMLERSVRVVQVGLLSLLFVFAGFLRLRWPRHVFGVALGFAIFSTVELASVTMRAQGGIGAHGGFVFLKPLAFVVAQFVWFGYFALPERAAQPELQSSPHMAGWNDALAELLRR